MKTATNDALIQVAQATFDALELANDAIARRSADDPTFHDSPESDCLRGRRMLAAELLFTLTGFRALAEDGRAAVVMGLAVLGVPRAQAILNAEFDPAHERYDFPDPDEAVDVVGTDDEAVAAADAATMPCVNCGRIGRTELVHERMVGEVRMCERCYLAARQVGMVD